MDLNRGIVRTFFMLWLHPGTVAASYVGRQTVRYTNPVKYFLILAALSQLAGSQLIWSAWPRLAPTASDEALQLLRSSLPLALAAGIPIVSALTRVAFYRAGYNYAEHVIFNLYTGAHLCIVGVCVMLASDLAPQHPLLVLTLDLVFVGYYARACSQFFRAHWLTATLRAVATLALGIVVELGMLSALSHAYAALSR